MTDSSIQTINAIQNIFENAVELCITNFNILHKITPEFVITNPFLYQVLRSGELTFAESAGSAFLFTTYRLNLLHHMKIEKYIKSITNIISHKPNLILCRYMILFNIIYYNFKLTLDNNYSKELSEFTLQLCSEIYKYYYTKYNKSDKYIIEKIRNVCEACIYETYPIPKEDTYGITCCI